MPNAEPEPQTNSPLLMLLMAAHLGVVILATAAIAYLWFRSLTSAAATDPLLWAALMFPGLIGLGRYANGVECVLQTWAKRLRGVETGWARDVLWLPESWAQAIPPVCTPLYLLGAGLAVGRLLEQAASAQG